MQGVEILTSTQIITESVFHWTVFWGVLVIAMLIGTVIVVVDSIQNGFDDFVMFIVFIGFLILGGVVGAAFGDACDIPVAYETQYQITISDEVSMAEFYEHYEVIEQDGKIFTVREKTNE